MIICHIEKMFFNKLGHKCIYFLDEQDESFEFQSNVRQKWA